MFHVSRVVHVIGGNKSVWVRCYFTKIVVPTVPSTESSLPMSYLFVRITKIRLFEGELPFRHCTGVKEHEYICAVCKASAAFSLCPRVEGGNIVAESDSVILCSRNERFLQQVHFYAFDF